jgi:hypothetical protein
MYANNFFRLIKIALVICFGMPLSVRAAEFVKSPSSNGEPDIIFVVGNLVRGDEMQFINIALSSGNAIVVFESRGGSLLAGIEIGKTIRLKGFATFVPDTVQCASACALAWLGGRVRFMSNSARVGFHAAYVDDGGQAAVSSAGNALVGAYLNQLGLPASAIVYITDAPPEGMQWLSFEDAQRYGIDVRQFEMATRSAAVQRHEPSQTRNEPSQTFSSEASSVTKEFYEFIDATNLSSDQSLAYLQGKYPDQLNYYGKMLSKALVLNEKRAFFKKWPTRNYSIQPSSAKVSCESASECTAEGIVDWEASGSILNSQGSAAVTLKWTLEGNIWKITSENSSERKTARPAAR